MSYWWRNMLNVRLRWRHSDDVTLMTCRVVSRAGCGHSLQLVFFCNPGHLVNNSTSGTSHCTEHNALLFWAPQRVKGWKELVTNQKAGLKSRDHIPPISKRDPFFSLTMTEPLCVWGPKTKLTEGRKWSVRWSVLHPFYTFHLHRPLSLLFSTQVGDHSTITCTPN